MTPPPPSAAPVMSPPAESRPVPQSSTLGGAKDIAARFQAAMKGEDTRLDAKPKAEAPVAPAAPVAKPEAPEPKSPDSILPPEKPVAKSAPAEPPAKPEPEKPKVGSDGMTKEERAELVRFKKEAERAQELEIKVKEYEATAKEVEELRKLKGELEEKTKRYEAKALAFDLESSDHFQETYAKPIQRLQEAAVKLAKGYSLEPVDVFSAIFNHDLTKGNATLSEQMSSMNALDARTFERIINDLRERSSSAQEALSKAPEAWTAIQVEDQKRAEEKKAKDKETYTAANKVILGAMQERFPFIKEKNLGEEFLKEANEFNWDELSPNQKATLIQSYSVALRVNPLIDALQQEIESLKTALGKQNNRPGPSNGDRPAPTVEEGVEEERLKNMTPGERFMASLGRR